MLNTENNKPVARKIGFYEGHVLLCDHLEKIIYFNAKELIKNHNKYTDLLEQTYIIKDLKILKDGSGSDDEILNFSAIDVNKICLIKLCKKKKKKVR